jgi:hypothetical protein
MKVSFGQGEQAILKAVPHPGREVTIESDLEVGAAIRRRIIVQPTLILKPIPLRSRLHSVTFVIL